MNYEISFDFNINNDNNKVVNNRNIGINRQRRVIKNKGIDKNNFDKYCQKMVAPIQNVYYFKSLAENSAGLIIPNFHSKWVKNNAHSSNELNEDPLSILIEYIWVDKIDASVFPARP